MTEHPALLLPVAALVYTTVVSLPVTILTIVLAEFTDTTLEALAYMFAGVGGVTALGILALAAVLGPAAGVGVLVTAVTAAIVLTALPIWLGWVTVGRFGGGDRNESLRDALIGWPVGLLVALAILGSPVVGGADLFNAPGEVAPNLVGIALVAIYLAPPLFGLGIARGRRQISDRSDRG